MKSIDWSSAVLSHPKLKATDRLVALILGHHGAMKEACYPSHARIAQEAKLGRQTVMRCLKRLEAAGFIHRTPGRTGKATFYRLRIPSGDMYHSGTPHVPAVTGTCTTGNPPTKNQPSSETTMEQEREQKRQAALAKVLDQLGVNWTADGLDAWTQLRHEAKGMTADEYLEAIRGCQSIGEAERRLHERTSLNGSSNGSE